MKLTRKKKFILFSCITMSLVGTGVMGAYYFHSLLVTPPATAFSALPEENLPTKVKISKHIVAAGENLTAIAEHYHLDVATIEDANHLTDETVQIGQELIILPQPGLLHQVSTGDTLWSLARQYQVSVDSIRDANYTKQDRIAVGENIFIPGGRPRGEPVTSRGQGNRFIWPTTGEISSPFGYRWGRLHEGIDIANDEGTPVQAARDGQVTFAGWYGGYGYAVIIDHGQEISSLYGHLSDYYVKVGQFVRHGQTVAAMGSTGEATGPHLHFEIHQQNKPVSPTYLLPSR